MATINTQTLDDRKLTPFFIQTKDNGLQQLPFYLVTIDHDFQAYMPCDLSYHDSNSRRLRGQLTPPVILRRDSPLPLPPQNANVYENYAVFEYHGV